MRNVDSIYLKERCAWIRVGGSIPFIDFLTSKSITSIIVSEEGDSTLIHIIFEDKYVIGMKTKECKFVVMDEIKRNTFHALSEIKKEGESHNN